MKPVLLIDRLYRATFQRGPVLGWHDNATMRRALEGAYRFSADDAMSAFMADLANEAFLKAVSDSVSARIADSLRVQARVPHEAIWIEYNLHAYQIRARAMRGKKPPNIDDVPEREGWLIQQHPAIDTAVMMHLFTASNRLHEDGNDTWTFPLAFGWTCDDSPLPWQPLMKNPDGNKLQPSELLVGLGGYKRSNINCVRSPLIVDPTRVNEAAYASLLSEWTGVIRRVFALLATIDNLPITRGVPRPAKGFLSRGRIRPYLQHSTITLNIPARTDTRVLARKAVAAAHRMRHRVRAHWREDFRHPPVKGCPHIWRATDDAADHISCDFCGGKQIFVHKHERGHGGIGFVTHDYKLTHGSPAS
jgi:hypothetical protein